MAARKGKKLICPNCGWENFARATKCQVCTCPLVVGAKAPSERAHDAPVSDHPGIGAPVAPVADVAPVDVPFDANWLSVPGVTDPAGVTDPGGSADPVVPPAGDPGDRYALAPPSWQYSGDTPPADAVIVGEDRKDFWHLPVFDPLDPLPPPLPPPPASLPLPPPPLPPPPGAS